ncbi:MAG TPA: rubredoxin [Geomonas sp.]|nr:rubredoxin [Geomonas sp.]
MQSWVCTICQYIYDPADGDLVNDVPPGVSFEELLQDWTCPVCKAGKTFFQPAAPAPGGDSPR